MKKVICVLLLIMLLSISMCSYAFAIEYVPSPEQSDSSLVFDPNKGNHGEITMSPQTGEEFPYIFIIFAVIFGIISVCFICAAIKQNRKLKRKNND